MLDVIKQFKLKGQYVRHKPYGEGHINDTYLVETKDNKSHYYILQRINDQVFPDVSLLMNNILSVTKFLRKKIIALGGDPDRESLTIFPTLQDEAYLHDKTGYYRVYLFIENATTYQQALNDEMFYHNGYAIGKFQALLEDFNTDLIGDIIPFFHHTPTRYKTFCDAVSDDRLARASSCQKEIEFIHERKDKFSIIIDLIEKGEIPLKVTHNDTKLNNVMIDNDTKKGICLIDLDTIMKGSLLYDFGDAIRFGANTALEDEVDLNKVHFDFNLFKVFTKGFLDGIGDKISEKEKSLLPMGAYLMTIECGMRFLTDYLEGDVYFKIKHPLHNLERAKNQFKLLSEMEEKLEEMYQFVNLTN